MSLPYSKDERCLYSSTFPYNNTNGENTELGIRGQQSHFQRQFEILEGKKTVSTLFAKVNGAVVYVTEDERKTIAIT